MEETKLAYIAGLIDGEGTITIARSLYPKKKKILNGPMYAERVLIGMNYTKKNYLALNMIKQEFKGVLSIEKKIYNSKNSFKSSGPRIQYKASNKIAINLLNKIFPYLIIKKNQAKLVFKLRRSIENTWKKRKKLKGFVTLKLTKNIYKYREKLWKQIKILHHSKTL